MSDAWMRQLEVERAQASGTDISWPPIEGPVIEIASLPAPPSNGSNGGGGHTGERQ